MVTTILQGGTYLHKIFSSEQQVKAIYLVKYRPGEAPKNIILSKFGATLQKMGILKRYTMGTRVSWRLTDFGEFLTDRVEELGEEFIAYHQMVDELTERVENYTDEEIFYNVGAGLLLSIFWKTPKNLRFLTLATLHSENKTMNINEIIAKMEEKYAVATSYTNMYKILQQLREPNEKELEINKRIVKEWSQQDYSRIIQVKLALAKPEIIPEEKYIEGYKITNIGKKIISLAITIVENLEAEEIEIEEMEKRRETLESENMEELAKQIDELMKKHKISELEEVINKIKRIKTTKIIELLYTLKQKWGAEKD